MNEQAKCPGCSGEVKPLTSDPRLGRCAQCGGLIGLAPVSECCASFWTGYGKEMDSEPSMDGAVYFDLMVRGRDGKVTRTHGFYSRRTHLVLQYG